MVNSLSELKVRLKERINSISFVIDDLENEEYTKQEVINKWKKRREEMYNIVNRIDGDEE